MSLVKQCLQKKKAKQTKKNHLLSPGKVHILIAIFFCFYNIEQFAWKPEIPLELSENPVNESFQDTRIY